MRRNSLLAFLVITVSAALAGRGLAQSTAGGFAPGFSWPSYPGTYHPNDNAPYSHRYNYGVPIAYPGCGGRQMLYMEYLDRVDRAEKFGYQLPPPPNLGNPCCQPRIGVGVGFFQRIR